MKIKYTICQNLLDTVKVILRRQFITLSAYIVKGEKSQIGILSFYHNKLEK